MTPFSQYLMIGKLVALLAAIGIVCFQSGQIHKWHVRADAAVAARAADRATYAQAQKDAKAKNDAQLARIKSEQQGITTHVEQTYEADLARLRGELGRLLAQPKSAPGAARSPAAPDLPNTAPVADDPSRVSIPTGLYVRGAELELQLERLQEWVRQQVAVDPNK